MKLREGVQQVRTETAPRRQHGDVESLLNTLLEEKLFLETFNQQPRSAAAKPVAKRR
jgi:hypothetical protein